MNVTSTEVVRQDDGGELTGLEDFDIAKDAVMPRLQIDHINAVFKDNLSGETFNSAEVILLGLVKQRILWDPEVKDDAVPLCKSYDFNIGHPDPKEFPWKSTGFDQSALDPDDPVLPCQSCPLKDWGSHPRNETPWCSEQHVFGLLLPVGDPDDGGGWAPAMVTFQRSAMKASRAYLSAFARAKTPLYTVKTKLALVANKRGSVDYAVPSFTKADATEQAEWPYYADAYRGIRQFLTTPRRREEDDGTTTPVDTSSTPAPAKAAAPKAAAPEPAAAPVADDDDVPF